MKARQGLGLSQGARALRRGGRGVGAGWAPPAASSDVSPCTQNTPCGADRDPVWGWSRTLCGAKFHVGLTEIPAWG